MRTLLLLSFLSVAACAGSQRAAEPGEARIEVGESAVVSGMEVEFLSVVRDNRCPAGVECVQAGEAVVALSVDGRRVEARAVDPEVSDRFGVEAGDWTLHVASLVPAPSASGPATGTPTVTVVTRANR